MEIERWKSERCIECASFRVLLHIEAHSVLYRSIKCYTHEANLIFKDEGQILQDDKFWRILKMRNCLEQLNSRNIASPVSTPYILNYLKRFFGKLSLNLMMHLVLDLIPTILCLLSNNIRLSVILMWLLSETNSSPLAFPSVLLRVLLLFQ